MNQNSSAAATMKPARLGEQHVQRGARADEAERTPVRACGCAASARRSRRSVDGRRDAEQRERREHEGRVEVHGASPPARARAELAQDRAHAPLFGRGERRELVAGEIAIEPTEAREQLAPFGGADHRLDDGGEPCALLGRDAGRCDERAPVLELDVDAALAQRRRIDAGQALARSRRRARAACRRRSAAANSARPLMPTDTCPPRIAASASPPPEKPM